MGLWDNLKKLIGGKKPAATPRESPATNSLTPDIPPPSSIPISSSIGPPLSPPAPPASPPPASLPPASEFLPISRKDLLNKGEEVRRTTGWMWFGRRDLIPPTSDSRTLLIDRGMLTEGMLTADELAEMHRTGDEWMKHVDQVRQIDIQAGKSAEEAVQADRAARAEAKVRKKAEAEAKRAARAEIVARRKATDIGFIGRGVSARMGDRTSDFAKLSKSGLPTLRTPADLAVALGLTVSKLRWLCFHTEAATRIHYVQFEVPKKSGGMRVLSAPHTTLAVAQMWVLQNILEKLPVEDAAHGFVPGRSTVTNARMHVNRDLVINLDLEAFFPSIGFARVRHLFQRIGYSGAVSTLLTLLCTECPRRRVEYAGTPYFVATGPRGLPQGACTSPAISNQIARRLDRRLGGLCAKLGLAYTRYADDLTFSAAPGFREKIGWLIARVRHIVQDEGFAINVKKTRVQRPESRQSVTGLVVNAAPAVPRDMVRRIRAILHRAKREGLAAQNREKHPNFRGWVEGMIAYIAMVKPETGAKLKSELEAIAV